MLRSVSLMLLLAACIHAQAGPPTYVPKHRPVMRIVLAGIDELLATWPKLRIHPLIEEYGLAERLRASVDASKRRRHAVLLRQEAVQCGIEPEGYQLSNMMNSVTDAWFTAFDTSDFRQIELMELEWRGDDGRPRHANVSVSSCTPRALGRWAKHFEDEIAWWRDSGWFEARNAKVDGLPVRAFVIPQSRRQPGLFRASEVRWFLQLPGAFVDASGPVELLDDFGQVELAPPARPAGVSYDVDLAALGEIAGSDGPARLLFDSFEHLRFAVFPQGDLLREELEVRFVDRGGRRGLGEFLFDGSGAMPAQALPDPALLQLRAKLELGALFELLDDTAGAVDLRIWPVEKLRECLDGRVAVGVCAPPPGSVIPRVYATLGLSDVEAFESMVDSYKERGMPCREVVYGGTACTVIADEKLPQGIRPTFCVVGNVLHIAESALSMKAFLRAQRSGAEAMACDGAVEPATLPGDRVTSLELRFDPAAAYRAFYDVWFPVMRLGLGSRTGNISRDDLPDPDDFADYAVPVRAVFYRDGRRAGLQSVGTLGGMVTTIYATLMPVFMDAQQVNFQPLHGPLTQYKLEKVAAALERFAQRNGRAPKDLGELVAAENLPADVLLMPGDEHAEPVRLPNGRTVSTSFRYFPEPVPVQAAGPQQMARMIEIAPRPSRSILASDGRVYPLWGEDALRPIDAFKPPAGDARK